MIRDSKKPLVKGATNSSKAIRPESSITTGRANKGTQDGAKKAMEISDKFATQAFTSGLKSDYGAIKSPAYASGNRKPGSSTGMAQAADAAFGRNKPLAKKGK